MNRRSIPKPTPAAAPAAEVAVIGCVVTNPETLATAHAAGLTAEHFQDATCRKIWQAIAQSPDAFTPASIGAAAGIPSARLEKIVDAGCIPSHLPSFAGELIEAHSKHELGFQLQRGLVENADVTKSASFVAGVLRDRLAELASVPDANAMPAIVDAETFTGTAMPEPPHVINGVLHRGSKAVYGGPSKAFKSWTLLDLCLAVSTGKPWLGFDTTPGNVLYLNFELQPFAVHKRLLAIAQDRQCAIPSTLHVWNLRGFARPLSALLPDLLRQIKGEGYALIVPDPIYKTLDGRDENGAGDIGALCQELDQMAVATGAAIAFGAHFAKGNASGKEHIDRVSGSGVWARDPDAILTATTHEEQNAFTLEMTLRNFAPVDPFVIRWDYPRMRRDDTADPARLKQVRGGRVEEYPIDAIVKYLTAPMNTTAWFKACADETGISRKTFFRRMADAEKAGLTERDGTAWKRKAARNIVKDRF